MQAGQQAICCKSCRVTGACMQGGNAAAESRPRKGSNAHIEAQARVPALRGHAEVHEHAAGDADGGQQQRGGQAEAAACRDRVLVRHDQVSRHRRAAHHRRPGDHHAKHLEPVQATQTMAPLQMASQLQVLARQ